MSKQKEWVKKQYGAIAKQTGKGCCGPAPCDCDQASKTAVTLGYSQADITAAPEGANLGLGCGNPLALASIVPGETVLDLGAGAGFDAFLAAAHVGPTGRVIGVDITPEMVEKAQANAAREGYANVEFRLGDIENMPVENNSIDLIISNCVLNLVPDKDKAFREMARVLKPGGRMAISDIVLDKPLPERLKNDANAYCACVSGAANRGEYLSKLAAAGLIDIQVVAETDAAKLLAGDCCDAGAKLLAGVVTSIQVVGRKPASAN